MRGMTPVSQPPKGSLVMGTNVNYELFLRKEFRDEELTKALGSLLGIDPTGILVVDDITETKDTADVIV